MKYNTYTYDDLGTTARFASFQPTDGISEGHLMITVENPQGGFKSQLDAVTGTLSRFRELLPQSMHPVFKRFFLSDAANQAHELPIHEECAVSVVEQPPLSGSKVALWVYFQEQVEVTSLDCGLYSVSHGNYRHLWQGSANCPGLHSAMATRALLGDLAINIENEGGRLSDNCVRTWFFVQNVDVNYRGVVDGRNEMFKIAGLTDDTHFIASTGIGGRHADHNVIVEMDSYSVNGLITGQIGYLYAADRMNRTAEYGVAFERGTTVDYGDRRHIFISGTASIDNRGEIMYPDDVARQTERMLGNVNALLSEAGCGFDSLCHAIVYLRDVADYKTVRHLIDVALPSTPRVIVYAPVCRPGWLIEMECMATIPVCNHEYAPL